MNDDLPEKRSDILIYQTEDSRTRIDVRLEAETVWLPQAAMAELYQTTKQNVSLHLKNIFSEGELVEERVVKNYLTTAADEKRYHTNHYNLDAIIAVGYRVRSHRGTQFRIWATQRLREYIVKGFTLDDERLKQAGGGNYFDELLARIRDIRASEKVFWRKVLEIYATSIDYDPATDLSHEFFAVVQNKMHWATHGHTAAEIVSVTDRNENRPGYKKTKVGWIPENWMVKSFGTILKKSQYGLSVSFRDNGNTPILRMGNIENGKVIFQNLAYINIADCEKSKYTVKENELLFNRTNSLEHVGKLGIVKSQQEAVFASYIVRLKVDSSLANPAFIAYMFNTTGARNRLKRLATPGVCQHNINQSDLQRQFEILLPPITEQKKSPKSYPPGKLPSKRSASSSKPKSVAKKLSCSSCSQVKQN
ncbi:MAG: virulence RhuM family protein [Deltaproteobacteria bacterium]|nr:virulence RhuM family protein [Deltaproteobacteria bacterium]